MRSLITPRLVLLVLLSVLASLAVLSSSSSAIDIVGDWHVTSDTVLSNEIINVRGNVTIDAHLTLTNCDLWVNGSVDGNIINVTSRGKLSAYGCLIGGHPYRIHIIVWGDTTFTGCTTQNLYASTYDVNYHGIHLMDGDIVLRDSTFTNCDYYLLQVYTDLEMVNCTFTNSRYGFMFITNAYASSPMDVSITGCRFDGTNDWASVPRGITFQGTDIGPYLDLRIDNCTMATMGMCFFPYTYGNITAIIEDCVVTDCYGVADIKHTGGDITLRKLRGVSKSGTSGNNGVKAEFITAKGLVLRDLDLTNYYTAVNVEVGVGPDTSMDLQNISIRGSEYGIRVVKSVVSGHAPDFVYLTIGNCSISSTTTAFWVSNARTDVYDTECERGSARVSSYHTWIRGHALFAPPTVQWYNGPDIASGTVRILNETDSVVAMVDAANLRPRHIVGWEATTSARFINEYVVPEMTIDGRTWRGKDYDLWRPVPDPLEILDDLAPTVTVEFPTPSTALDSASFIAYGDYSDEGSGLARVEYSLDEAPFEAVTSAEEGAWVLSLSDLSDDHHAIRIRGVDRTGGKSETVLVGFTVDTGPPVLDITNVPKATNSTRLDIIGWTEPGATVTVEGNVVNVLSDGSFRATVELEEGDNLLEVRAMDPMGNVNTTTLIVVLDSTPPSLDDISPANGTWTHSTTVVVEGTVDPGDRVWLMGGVLTVTDGAFREVIELDEGDWDLSFMARDPAGNEVRKVVEVHVDLTPPVLTFTSPEHESSHTREDQISLDGQVDEANIGEVTVNGDSLAVYGGFFGDLLELVEGDNHFTVVARDLAGNEDWADILVVRDTTPPLYTITVEASTGEIVEDGGVFYIIADKAFVRFMANEIVVVTTGDGERFELGSGGTVPFNLTSGTNRLTFHITDLAGNEGLSYETTLELDALAPVISMESPEAEAKTTRKEIIVRGNTEPGSTIAVNGKDVTVLPSGLFQVSVPLKMGTNEITIEAVDRVGHTNSTTLTVTRKEKKEGGPPVFSVVAPLLALVVVAALMSRRLRQS